LAYLERFTQRVARCFGRGGVALRNDESLHLWSVATATEPNVPAWRAVLAAALSIALVCMQLFILSLVAYASAHPPCHEHASCRDGEFCSILSFQSSGRLASMSPRCSDCLFAPYQVAGAGYSVAGCANQTSRRNSTSPTRTYTRTCRPTVSTDRVRGVQLLHGQRPDAE
jgi:hypothetical protein